MLTGKPAFPGEDVTEILAGVVKSEPDWSALPAATAPSVRFLLRRCLEKDAKRRFHSAADVRILIEAATAADAALSPAAAVGALSANWKTRMAWVVILLAACGATGLAVWKLRPSLPSPPVARFTVSMPQNRSLYVPPTQCSSIAL